MDSVILLWLAAIYNSAVEIGCSGGDRVFDDRYVRWLHSVYHDKGF